MGKEAVERERWRILASQSERIIRELGDALREIQSIASSAMGGGKRETGDPPSGEVPEEEFVYIHDGNCNDYTGCNDGCGWIFKSQAVYRMGAWRRA